MGTTVERDLKTLRTSKLMNFSEFKSMMVVLEKYHKEQAHKRKDSRELDMRPFLYDDGDTYEKPFYNILLKMLYEVASFKSHDKQHQDMLKVYDWFKSNQKLVACDSDDDINGCNSERPKLYLRPKTADHCYREATKETPTMKETRSRSVLSNHEYEKIRKKQSCNPLDRISVSLKVRPLNTKTSTRERTLETMESGGYGKVTRRHLTSSIPVYNARNNQATSLPSSFVLKPAKTTSPPVTTPVSTPSVSPMTSPRYISPSLSLRLSPVLRPQSPAQLTLSGHAAIEKRPRNHGEYLEVNDFGPATSPKQERRWVVNGNEINHISNINLMSDEEGETFQSQLEQRLGYETVAKTAEIIDDVKKHSSLLEEERQDLESQLVREHLQYMKERFNTEHTGGHKKTEQVNGETLLGDDQYLDTSIPLVNIYDLSEHRPVSAVTFRERAVRVESVADMVQPVGHQMEYEREMRNRKNGGSIWDNEYDDNLMICDPRRVHSAPSCHVKYTNGLNKVSDHVARLNQTEPILNPEKKASDYTVHFPHQCNREPSVKDFKTSGPVAPDTIRYQWTDDGFGNRTYVKRRSPKETMSSKSSRKSAFTKNEVAMTTGERGLDKRTIASLMVIKHLGTTNRRDRCYPRINVEESKEYNLNIDDNPDDYTPKRNVEYLPFWKQMPSKKELTILNFPETSEPPVIPFDDIRRKDYIMNVSQASLTEPRNSSSPQQIMDEMFTSLSRNKRTSPKRLDTTLSIKAQSISPTIRQSTAKSTQANRKLTINPAISPAPSRPSSARREPSLADNKCQDHLNFSIKNFSHFCFDDNYELLDDYVRQRATWAAVSIQRIFRGHIARQYALSLRQAEKDRQRKAAVALQSTFRGYLARKKLIKDNMTRYKPGVRDLQWAKEYKEKLKEKEIMRNKRNQGILKKQNRQLEKQQEQILGVIASDRIHEIFNPPKPTKAQMKAAAITIQRYFRGWFVRKSQKTVKEKALKRTFSFNKFIKSYQGLLYRIQERYNIEKPTTALQFHQLQEYVQRLFKYEIAFGRIAENGVLKYEDIVRYFAECGHHPSEKELDDAIALVTKGKARGRNLTKAEAVEVVFQIYIPKGTGLSLADVRKSTWVNPLINGEDVTKVLSKKDLKFTNLDKCLSLVAGSQGDRSEVKELLRPPDPRIMSVVEHTKGKDKYRPSSPKVAGGGKLILPRGQYNPVKPSENKQGKKRRPASGNLQK